VNATQTTDFTVTVHRESDHFWAEVDDLPGCFATGFDENELRECLEEAISLYLFDLPHAGTLSDVGTLQLADGELIQTRVSLAR
jgi:predicted RNase H-like HicB family nuclease